MEAIKICKENQTEFKQYYNCSCQECQFGVAEGKLIIAGKEILLCKKCMKKLKNLMISME